MRYYFVSCSQIYERMSQNVNISYFFFLKTKCQVMLKHNWFVVQLFVCINVRLPHWKMKKPAVRETQYCLNMECMVHFFFLFFFSREW